jgi:hypothetical protein
LSFLFIGFRRTKQALANVTGQIITKTLATIPQCHRDSNFAFIATRQLAHSLRGCFNITTRYLLFFRSAGW